MFNAKELVSKGIITGNIPAENVQMHGVDLNLIAIKRIVSGGYIPVKGKTTLGVYEDVPQVNGRWYVQPGVYDVTFAQGCDIPNDTMLLIRQRSSLLRNGAMLHSSVFDAGFKTDNIGTVITVQVPLDIEVGARIAQIYSHQGTPVSNEDLYDGQWQGDKQREGTKVLRKTRVIARTQIEGIHRWDGCDIKEVNYLRNNHRHVFHIQAEVSVTHHDRDVEFIELSHKIKQYLNNKYWSDTYNCAMFSSMSCEMLANELIDEFGLYSCEVNEDGEGGAIVFA